MAVFFLSLDSLKELDMGKVQMAFNHELTRTVKDCVDRPGDTNPRKVAIELSLTPQIDKDTGQCEGVHGEFKVRSKTPDRVSKVYDFGLNKKGQLYFNAESPENHRQYGLGEMDSEGTVHRQVEESEDDDA